MHSVDGQKVRSILRKAAASPALSPALREKVLVILTMNFGLEEKLQLAADLYVETGFAYPDFLDLMTARGERVGRFDSATDIVLDGLKRNPGGEGGADIVNLLTRKRHVRSNPSAWRAKLIAEFVALQANPRTHARTQEELRQALAILRAS
jgi:hypothetical protein